MTNQKNNSITEVNLSVLTNINNDIKNIDQEANGNGKPAIQKTLDFYSYYDIISTTEILIRIIEILSIHSCATPQENLDCINTIAEITRKILLKDEACFLSSLLTKEDFNKDKFVSIKEFEKLLKNKNK
ncbi:hypothetical protein [Bergeyella zoohelcum]|uniref:EF-hand domain-containing protein n=1 Tax=Bergeyella zoohelcum TaxID=1015 RepID=A0A376BZG0_9FLAO|nr:hypothetical protein [Bergeyella zoohelcum]EKB60954.1 hypothetical protein HMPREF9700_00449 [Bergeyella zoohelcum CCUG 30536]SSZ46955.1 Uncharacterised protein [Bergeyella zoohelcum]